MHDRIRAYGSLAAEVADAGVPGVVAMRYNVYVVTAAQFVADLYAQLAAGRSLGAAVSAARKALAADPNRRIGAAPVALQDWVVPTVYERAVHADRCGRRADRTHRRSRAGRWVRACRDAPDIGFFGRDETLLALDRAFDTDRIVLLHALAGAGKTHHRGGVRPLVRRHRRADARRRPGWCCGPRSSTTAAAAGAGRGGRAFAPLLEASGIHWAAVTDPAVRRTLVLQVLAAVPVLWVWDNVEPVAGFPAGTPRAWTDARAGRAASSFLRDLGTDAGRRCCSPPGATSTRWLGELPAPGRAAADADAGTPAAHPRAGPPPRPDTPRGDDDRLAARCCGSPAATR